MDKLQTLIFNEGERLIPYVTHNNDELVRHRSSYAFFHAVITADLADSTTEQTEVSIADLGFGCGFGCALLSSLPNSNITGIDISPECKDFAYQYYARSNVTYHVESLNTFIPNSEMFDYVVSRGVLEHVPAGLELIKDIKFRRRVMIDVPYDELPGNQHHELLGITEEDFSGFLDCELFYEDLEGRIFDSKNKPEKPNMIMMILSAPFLPAVSSMFQFPIPPVLDNQLEIVSQQKALGSHYFFDMSEDLLLAIHKAVEKTEVVLDIGCGIVPMNYFRPKLHLMVEPWWEYYDILKYRHAGDKSVLIFRVGALEILQQLADGSVDSIFLLDVIEHLEKEVGAQVIEECIRIARQQIVVFTPLGFFPQHMNTGELDSWGLHGNTYQEHRSGWEPKDFTGPSWSFYICENHHHFNHKNQPLAEPQGAFYAVCNLEVKEIVAPQQMSDIRLPLPSELEVIKLKQELAGLKQKFESYLRQSIYGAEHLFDAMDS